MAARLEAYDFLFKIDTYIACVISCATSITLFFLGGYYNTFTRDISTYTALTIVIAAVMSAFLLFTLIIFDRLQIPRSVPFIQVMFFVLGMASLRFFIQALGQYINFSERKNIAIYGAGDFGRQLVAALKWDKQYRLCMVIDDNPELQGQSLGGLKIEGFDAARKKLILNKIDTILLAIANTPFDAHERISDLMAETAIKVKSIPDLASLISGNADIVELRDIDIVDLLGRKPTEPDPKLLSQTITGRIVLVTGAGGSIGSELCRQIARGAPKCLVMLDVSEFAVHTLSQELAKLYPSLSIVPLIGSVQDQSFINKVMGRFAIETVFHAAAYKHVPLMEQNVMQCITNNVFGTRNMATAAITAQVEYFILVSTDKAVNPTNFMGASKRLAELVCKDISKTQCATHFGIVRFGNVLGSSGSVVPHFKQQIVAGGPVTVTHADITRYFMTIPEAAQLVIQAGALAKDGDIFVLDMGPPMKILDLAKKMVILSGKKPVMETDRLPCDGEITISFTGLRPGEKMFEELSYGDNLISTAHPRIMKTDDEGLSRKSLEKLLDDAINAISNNDHQRLVQIVRRVCDGVPSEKKSSDVFFNRN